MEFSYLCTILIGNISNNMHHIKRCFLVLLLLSLFPNLYAGNDDRPYFCRVKEFSAADGLTQEHIVDFTQDRQGFIWFGTWNGLVRYDGYRFVTFKPVHSPVRSNRIICMRLYRDGNIWCTTYDGRLHIFDVHRCAFVSSFDADREKGWQYRPGVKKLQRHSANINYRDRYGNVIEKQQDGPFLCRDAQTGKTFPLTMYDERGITNYNPEIKDYAVDRQGNLWLIMSRKLARITFYPCWFRHRPNGSNTETRALYADCMQRLWVGCKDGKLRLLSRNGSGVSYLTSDGRIVPTPVKFSNSNVYIIYCDRKGRLWIGTKGDGLFCLTPADAAMSSFSVQHFKHTDKDNTSISSNEIYDITEDRQGRLWIGTWKCGVNIVKDYHGLSFINIHNGLKVYLSGNMLKVRCLQSAPDGSMLVGTAGGLVIMKNGKMRHILHGTDVMRIVSAKGRIFLCLYAQGLCEVQTSDLMNAPVTIKNLESDGSTNEGYINAVYDGRSSIWLFSESSVLRYNIFSERFSFYDEDNFGGRFYFSEAKPTIIAHNEIIAGTDNGIFSFSPSAINSSVHAPHIAVSGLQYQGENYVHPVNDVETLHLSPSQRTLTLYLCTPDIREIAKSSFAYKLEGYDKEWNYIIKGNSISYGKLPPGDYRLKIRVSNAEGEWVNDVRSIDVVVVPMFIETTWFAFLVVVLILVALSGITYIVYYIRRLRIRQHQLMEYIEQNMRNDVQPSAQTAPQPSFAPPLLNNPDKEFLDKFTKIFLANICNDGMTIDDFAVELGMSHAVFYRKIKQLVGSTPVDFIRRLRVRRAVQYFDAGERQVSEVAYKTGFSDPKYFSKCFRKEMNCSPSEYCIRRDNSTES